jgi:hypothetical protein
VEERVGGGRCVPAGRLEFGKSSGSTLSGAGYLGLVTSLKARADSISDPPRDLC